MVDPFILAKILTLTTIAFVVAILWTPLLTNFLYRFKFGKSLRSKKQAPIFTKMHAKKAGTPTMGGVLIWGTVLFIAVAFLLIQMIAPNDFFGKLSFLTRDQTWLPLTALVAAGIVWGCLMIF